jgi:uncharacterized protein with ParB-like and HNH nuclease domain
MSNNNNSFSFAFEGIGSVLKSNLLAVPLYQREYSWTPDRVEQLLSDLVEAKKTHSEHFLGTIVTISRSNENESAELKIVDGQQRLTTTAILFSAIRNKLASLTDATLLVESINNEFLSSIDRKAKQRVSRLRLNIDDNDFFTTLTKDSPSELTPMRESHELMLSAAELCKQWVSQICAGRADDETQELLDTWIDFMQSKATVVLVKTNDGAQAFRMFETLNDRGLRTSQVDLVKSYLFGEAGNRISEAQTKWSSMRDNLQEIDDKDRAITFLRHYLICTRGFVRTEQVYSETQKYIRGISSSVTFLSELERDSRVYISTFNSDSSFWDSYSSATKKALKTYNKFDPKPVRPLLLAIALKFSTKEAERAIAMLLAIVVRSLISGRTRSGIIEQTYASAAISVHSGEMTEASEMKKSLTSVIVTDREFIDAFTSSKSSNASNARYFLRTLESAYRDDKEPWYVTNDDELAITLEHILPRNPTGTSWNAFDEESHRRNHKRLGNLCLLKKTENSNKSNVFEEDKSVYAASPLHFTNDVSTYLDWTPESINERQKKMAETAVKAWPIK